MPISGVGALGSVLDFSPIGAAVVGRLDTIAEHRVFYRSPGQVDMGCGGRCAQVRDLRGQFALQGHFVVGDGHRDFAIDQGRVFGALGGMGNDRRVVVGIVVLSRGNGHRLRRAPIGRRERQARRHKGQVAAAAHQWRHRHDFRWLGIQHHGVGRARTLGEGQGTRRNGHATLVVVGDGQCRADHLEAGVLDRSGD
jgi:hypothetical protein